MNKPIYIRRWSTHTTAFSLEGWLGSYLRYCDTLIGHENRYLLMVAEKGNWTFYCDEKDLQRSETIGLPFYLNTTRVSEYVKAGRAASQSYLKYCRKIYDINYESINPKELADVCEELFSRYIDGLAYYKLSAEEFCVGVERYLRQQLATYTKDVEATLQLLLSFDHDPLETFKERRSWLKLLREVGDLPSTYPMVRDRILRHTHQFGFLSAHGEALQGWHFFTRFQQNQQDGIAEVIGKLEDAIESGNTRRLAKAKSLNKLGISTELRQVIQNVSNCAFHRLEMRESFTKGAFLTNLMFKHIYSLVQDNYGSNIDTEILRQISVQDILGLLRCSKAIDVVRLQEKYRCFAYGIGLEGVWNKYGADALKVKNTVLPSPSSDIRQTSGMVAFSKGIVCGKAVVIDAGIHTHQKQRISTEMENGDILVTGMTHPNIMVACEKAAAIITDEGGITCHAAIVARELNIPCIVGTQNATEIFNTGELMKVDSITGTVEIVQEI